MTIKNKKFVFLPPLPPPPPRPHTHTHEQLAAGNVRVLHKKKLPSGGDALYCTCCSDAGHVLL
jgi:hypothetical protein